MAPPKAKLHKNTGRLKNINSSYVSSPSNGNQVAVNNQNHRNTQPPPNRTESTPVASTSSPSSGDSSAIEQFELEIYWCIQTLENSLNSGKLHAKQGMTRAIYTLNNS